MTMIWKLCKTGAEDAHAQPPAVKPKKKRKMQSVPRASEIYPPWKYKMLKK
jgi:hypothetical protein